MTVTIHPRETGATIRCDRCKQETITTGQIQVGILREHAARNGWGRGLRKRSTGSAETGTGEKANTRHDIGPKCMPMERAEDDQRKQAAAERRKKRDENRRARFKSAA